MIDFIASSPKRRVAPALTRSADRYDVLDGYRALAALLVVAFHYFWRWTELNGVDLALPVVPYLSENPLIASGALGVEFFFIISGFVIPLTLASTTSFMEFAVKRFARLFPAMLFCSVLTFVVVKMLNVAPFAEVSAVDFLPSLTFVAPYVWNTLTGLDTSWVSGVYWSLFVEIKFYAVAAALFLLARGSFLRNYLVFSVLLVACYWLARVTGMSMFANLLEVAAFPTYAGFFLAGIGFYVLFAGEERQRGLALLSIVLSFLYSIAVYTKLSEDGLRLTEPLVLALFFLLFVLFVTRSAIVAPLGNAKLAKIGAGSYALYLFHEAVGVSILHHVNSVMPSLLWAPAMTIAMVMFSIFVYDRIETPARRLMMAWYKRT